MISSSVHVDTAVICELFDGLFRERFSTCLRGGGDEPLYTPAVDDKLAVITFRSDYVSSALHEVSHWCLAGVERRALQDYGYWYQEDRDAKAQRGFEAMEARPQALEWIFSLALGIRFVPSRDNFVVPASPYFDCEIRRQMMALLQGGLPARAGAFANRLSQGRDYLCLARDLAVSQLKAEFK